MLRTLAFTLAAGLVATAAPAPAPALTLDQVLDHYVQARGGADHLKAIHSLRVSSHLVGAVEYPLVTEALRPDHFRQTVTVQGMPLIQAYDGKAGWTINPFSGYGGFTKPQPMNPEQLKEARKDADIDGPLVDWRAKGHKAEYLGLDEVEGSPVHKVHLTYADGDEATFYLDADTFLVIREEHLTRVRGTERETVTELGNYFQHAGVWMPHLVESGPRNSPYRQKVTVDKVEVNLPLDESRFAQPAAK